MQTQPTETIYLLTTEQRAACAACANDIEAFYSALPKAEKKHWWQRDPFVGSIAQLRQMAQYGNGGAVLNYTKSEVVRAYAAQHGLRVYTSPKFP